MKWLLLPVLLLIGAFCAYGVLATFEPTPNAMVFRIGYAVIGVACLVGIFWIFMPQRKA